MTERTITQFAIIGAGAGGMCAGIRLAETGRDDFLIFDKAPSVGGTWFRNAYPGACCDIPSHVYSYSFAPSAEWSKPYGTQPEILEYLEKIADDYGLRPHLRLSTGVASAAWDESRARWVLVLDSGDSAGACAPPVGLRHRTTAVTVQGPARRLPTGPTYTQITAKRYLSCIRTLDATRANMYRLSSQRLVNTAPIH